MGNSCSSGQAHKDKDNMSQSSEESPSYQVTGNIKKSSIPSHKPLEILNNAIKKSSELPTDQASQTHTGIILEPISAGHTSPSTSPAQKTGGVSKVLKGVAATSSISADSMSLGSPTGIPSPKEFDKSKRVIPAHVQQFSENLQHLLTGQVGKACTTRKSKKIVIYVCAADSQDCCVEKGSLHNYIYPEMRNYCRQRGYELHIVDLHWKTFLEKQQDHEFPELCLGELSRQMEVAYIIPVVFLNNSLGTPLLPHTIESADFKMALDACENETAQSLVHKWYQLDSAAQPPCYRLQPISSHIPGFKENSLNEREKALGEWQNEIERILNIMVEIFPQELRDTYLTTVVEQEIHNTVLMSQELAKRCIWLQRIYTPGVKTPENQCPGEQELQRRLINIQNDLRNELSEKHIVRIPVRYAEGGLDPNIPEHQQYIEMVNAHLLKHLPATIDLIVDEHQNKNSFKPNYGISATLFEELNHQISFCQRAAQCSVNREKVLNEVKSYITGVTDLDGPLIIQGPMGCGKTTLLARIAQSAHQWLNSAGMHGTSPTGYLVIRFVGISDQSSTADQILSSIANQFSILSNGHICYTPHDIISYRDNLLEILSDPTLSDVTSPCIIIIDGIDQVKPFGTTDIRWLPQTLPANIKLILSVTEDSEIQKELIELLPAKSFVKMPLLGEIEAKSILMNSVMQYNHSINSKIQDCVFKSVQECTLPLYAKVLAWQTSWWADKDHDVVPKGDIKAQVVQMLEELETILGKASVEHALALLTCTKQGIYDSEMLDLLAFDDVFQSKETYVTWAPACLFWSRLTKHLGPFLQWTLNNGDLTVQWRDNTLLRTAQDRYSQCTEWAHRMLHDYYMGKWWEEKPEKLVARLISQEIRIGKCYNRRKTEELPYQYCCINGQAKFSASIFLNDLNWIYDKICGLNCSQFLEDTNLTPEFTLQKKTAILKDFIQQSIVALNYDGRQFYSQLNLFLQDKKKLVTINSAGDNEDTVQEKLKIINEMLDKTKAPPVNSLLTVNPTASLAATQACSIDAQTNQTAAETVAFFKQKSVDAVTEASVDSIASVPVSSNENVFNKQLFRFDVVTRLVDNDFFVVTVSTARQEICVWDIKKCRKIRTLKGVTQPINLIPIDQFRCIVLCRRELRIYDLDKGLFTTKLKGVMNQKMPFYGIHDSDHIVALSRNRMYVNLMNINTGDCVTTFKAGEDRFLNSLLISGDGRVLVCGDETQKPFPLLVWNLTSKKLLYDLRIPHHDFITSLAAITYEGSYVSCVCHELDEPNPNFIVVYDLQSGTLFKKWKPSCNTVSIDISSQGSCVISGLEDARILVWDLITGNCRWTLYGHTAPVNFLRLDPIGSCFISTDSLCRDRSIRMWDLQEGQLIAVYTPKGNLTSCEITKSGKYVILALDGMESLVTLELRGPRFPPHDRSQLFYGNPENCGKIFDLNEQEKC